MVAAKHDLMARFTSTPYRPTGLAATDQALANCVELLEWAEALISDAVEEQHDLTNAPAPDLDLIAASSSALRDTASLLAGGDGRPDVDGLERCRAVVLHEIMKSTSPPGNFKQAAQISFHANAVAVAVLGVAFETLVASGLADPAWLEARRARWYTGSNAAARTVQRVSDVATAAHAHASLRSVWFVNSIRGAVALAVAVAVADVTTVQHGFWVVLGTLSVLRSNASATGATAVRAIAGTALGFVIGGALVVAIGGDETALWIVFPFAVLVAAYSPGRSPSARRRSRC